MLRNHKPTESDEEDNDEDYFSDGIERRVDDDDQDSDDSAHWFDDYADDAQRGHPLIPTEDLESVIQVDQERAQSGYRVMTIER